VFQPVRRGDEFVERESRAGLLRDRVADVGVGVDERRKHDGVAVGRSLLDPDDLAVRDDDPPLDRIELRSDEYRPLQVHM